MRIADIYAACMNEPHTKVLFRIPEADRKALRILAAEQDITTTELVRRLIRQYVTNAPARQDA